MQYKLTYMMTINSLLDASKTDVLKSCYHVHYSISSLS